MSSATYDYIVVGVGTAGAVMVHMLSKQYKVLGIESGRNYDHNPEILDSSQASMLDSKYLWKFFWQGETTFDETTQQSYHWPGGRLLGGCSSINGEQFVKGTVSLYDKWAKIGGEKWSADNVFRNYKQLETYHGKFSVSHGKSGPVTICQVPVKPTTFIDKITNALSKSSGIRLIDDYNIPDQEVGVFKRWQLTQHPDGTRVTSSNGFLTPDVMEYTENSNHAYGIEPYYFKINFNSTANKLIWDGNKVIGLEYIKNGQSKQAYAKKGVIMCAGIRTPEILQRSGLGDKAQLSNLGIKTKVNLPGLGANLVNQVLSLAIFSKNPDDPAIVNMNDIYSGGAFLPDPSNLDGPRKYQLIISGGDSNDTFSIAIIDLNPKSRGYSIIQDKDPYTAPEVVLNYLSNPDDLQSFVRAFQTYILQLHDHFISNQAQYKGYGLISPSLDIIKDTDALSEYITSTIIQTHHISSTAKMGEVVDGSGRVYGTQHLYIADNCIAPYINNGNTQSTAFLIGYTIANHLSQ